MGNRWKNAPARVKQSCAFGCGFALVVTAACLFMSPPASAVLFNSLTSASGSDYVIANGYTSWVASNGPAKVTLLAPGQEVVSGSEGWNTAATGDSSFDQEIQLDTRDIIQYNSIKKAAWSKLGTSFDSAGMTGMVEPVSVESGSCYTGWNATGTNERALQEISVIGRNVTLDTQVGITQLDSDIPDTLDVMHAATGNGFATITFAAQSQVGYAYTYQPGWQNDQYSRISGAGKNFQVGKKTQWRSFAKLFNSTFEATA